MDRRMRPLAPVVAAAALAALTACAPLTAPAPLHFAERAAPLERGQLRITAAGGGGGSLPFDGSGGGGALRVRAGVGARQELGAEVQALAVGTGKPDKNDPPYIGKSLALAYKLSWKLAPRDWFAIVVGLGGANTVLGSSLGDDLGVLFSRPSGIVRPYGGLRAIVAGPLGHQLDDGGDITSGFVTAGGLSLVLSSHVDLFAEAGGAVLFSTALGGDRRGHTNEHLGPFGLLALAIAFE